MLNDRLSSLDKIGSGTVYYLGIFKVYDATFYAAADADLTRIINGSSSKCLVLEYNLSISAENIIKGADVVLTRQHDKSVLDQQKQNIDTIHQSYTDVSEGDSYALCYDAGGMKTTLFFNGASVTEVESKEFANLYFGLWLGEKEPISKSLRKKLIRELTNKS